jgi:cyclopropane-fatty-acyl-phospholipid synthase
MNKRYNIVETCYDMLDVAFYGDVTDFTDGKYNGIDSICYIKAQENKAEWLLDKVKCKKGSSLLDIGCGYGRIVETANRHGSKAMGITLSKYQQVRNIKKGLNVEVMNYLDIPKEWNNYFDCVIANGSIEHFTQVQDAIDGKQDEILRNFFKICHRIMKPGSRLATTVMHFTEKTNPNIIAKGSKSFSSESDEAHLAKVLLENLG